MSKIATKQWTLAIGGSDHDASAALAYGADIRVAIEQERLSRRKHGEAHWYESPVQKAIDYCLAVEGILLSDVGQVVASDTIPTRVIESMSGMELRTFSHHLCHAAAAVMMLPPEKTSAVLVYDGYGSIIGSVPESPLRNFRETFSFFMFRPTGYDSLGTTVGKGYVERDEFPIGVTNSAGMLYEMVTGLLGYDLMDSGKTMGLSSYGMPRYAAALEQYIRYGTKPSDIFVCETDDGALVAMIENILKAGRGSFSTMADIAASVQEIIHKTLLNCVNLFQGLTFDYLCISGGCGLNTVANRYLVEHSPLQVPIIIPPHCGDAGLGLGALWLDQFEQSGRRPKLTFNGDALSPSLSRPGRLYTAEERRLATLQFYPQLFLDCTVRSLDDLARVLANGEIIGFFNGRSEIGPRALGGRSIIASPKSAMTRERINRLVKKREPFRPLAPMILESEYGNYFYDARNADPFMLKVSIARERCRVEAPAIVHIDGTSRVQVVSEDGDPVLLELLKSFHRQTRCPILLNTSFNRRGEPLVESPLDALDAFSGMGLDGLYLDGEFYRHVRSMRPSV